MKEITLLMSNLPDNHREAIREMIIEIAGATSGKITGRITFDCDFSQGAMVKIGHTESRTIFNSAKQRKVRNGGV